jgi:spore coat protein SA
MTNHNNAWSPMVSIIGDKSVKSATHTSFAVATHPQSEPCSSCKAALFCAPRLRVNMIYHVLPEVEPLSASLGGALAHTVANLLKLDSSRVGVCPRSDASWGIPETQALVIPAMSIYGRIRGRRHVPYWVLAPVVRGIFRDLLSRLQPGDIVWIHNRPAFAASLSGPVHSKGAKLVYHFHDGVDPRHARRCFLAVQPDCTIFVSDFLRRFWMRHIPTLKNTHVVHNGADPAQFFESDLGSSDSGKIPVIMFVGRLDPLKGVHVLIEAVRVLNTRGTKVICRVVGSSFSGGSKQTPYMKELARHCPENVEFLGHCATNELGRQYRDADMLCCPSIWEEPFGKVNIEAMACGLPVVASRVGGIPEIAAYGGVQLVEPGVVPELADALQKLIESPSLRNKMSCEASASFQKHFTWNVALNLYRTIAASLFEPIQQQRVGDSNESCNCASVVSGVGRV